MSKVNPNELEQTPYIPDEEEEYEIDLDSDLETELVILED